MKKLQTFFYQTSTALSVPLPVAFSLEILSSLQIIHLLFFSMAQFSTNSHHFITESLSRNLYFLTGAFPLQETYTIYTSLFYPIWIICLIYFLLHILIFLVIIKVFLHKEQGNRTIMKILSWAYLLHSRIVFFPMQFFLLNLCKLFKSSANGEFYQETGWLIGSIILLTLNSALALSKEFMMYHINQTDSHYSIKTNIYHQMMLIYKILALLLCFWGVTETSTAIKGSTFFHAVMSFLMVLILYLKLPFYHFKMLKLAIMLTSVTLCLSLVSIVYVFGQDSEVVGGMHILLLLLPPLGVKIVFSQFRNLFKRILQGEFMVVDHAVHYGLLLEEFIASEKNNSLQNKIFFLNRESFYGILVGKNIPLEKFMNRKELDECESYLYHHVMEKLSTVGNSRLLSLYTAQIYLTKGDNIPKALEIIRKLETSSNSSPFPIQTSILYLNDLLQRAYNFGNNQQGASGEGQLELSEYFKYYDLANDIKALMLLETKKHIEFWEDIQMKKTDAKKTYDRVEEIDRLFMRIRKECEMNLNNFRKNFRSPMLLYSIYLSNVRQMHYDGTQILRSFQSIMLAQNASGNNNNELDVTSGNTAVIVVSLDKIKAGMILNASGAIHNIFNLRKTELIGKKIGCLFPAAIAKKYQQSIHEYSKSPTYKLDHKEKTYGKTTTEEIFELEAHFQLYPYVGKELTVMIMLKKLDDPAPILIANNDGMIIEYSKSLKTLFQAENINLKNFQNLQSINANFEKVNLAFNLTYDENQQQMMSARSENKEKFFFNFDSTAGDFIEESSRNNSTQRPLINSNGGFGSPEKAKNTPHKRWVKMPPGKSGDTKLSFDKAQMICKEYIEGKETALVCANAQKTSRLRAHVQIKPYIIEGEVYKVMSILRLRKDIGSIYDSLENASSRSGLTFGDEFPKDNESVIVKNVMAKKNPKTKATMASTGGLEKVSYLIHESESEAAEEQGQDYETQKKLINIEKFFDQDERSSIKNSSQQESRTVRTLRDIGSRKKLQRSVGYLQILAYLVVGVILILSIVKFSLSKRSIEEIEKGINIINLSTGRLQSVINSWMYGLLLVAGNNFTSTTGNIRINTDKFADYNTRLKNELGLVRDKDFVNRAFQRDITFYQTAVTGDSNKNIIDTFTGTNILLTKYLAIQNAKSRTQVMMMPDVTQIFNNTCNDYVLSSINLNYATDTILHEIISLDIQLLDIVLAIEIVAMVSYISIFIIMVYIISKSYQRLCRALLRTQERSVSQRIAQLKKLKGLLEDDIERKGFLQDAFDLFIEERSMKASKREAKTQNGTANQTNLTMSSMNKHLTLIAVVSLIAIPMFAGLFIGTLVKSINTFNTLGSVNKGLTMLSVGYFQSSLLMSNFIYNMVFGSNPTMTLMNNAPKVQQLESLADFNQLNQKLIGSFLSSKDREIDPFLVEILQSNVCKHLDDIPRASCEISTNSQKMGLLNMNTDYYNTMLNVVTSIGPNTTLAQAVVMFAKILPKISGEMRVMQDIYPVMISHILENFGEEVSSSKQDEVKFIIIIFVTVIMYTWFMYLKPLKDFKRVDLGRRKVLKIVPASISQENKALKFYLMQDFRAEIEEIKNTL